MLSRFPLPWRSAWLPRVLTLATLVVAVPLFLRTPPWCDITLYQMAARNILHGGVHYQDLFDTNLPGFVWVVTALYWLFGPSAVAVRAVDLFVVTGIVLLIDRLAKWGGASLASRWWALAGAALIYPFTVEMAHAQRDTWMALPALTAAVLRLRRGGGTSPLRAAFAGGVRWGAAGWMKPHIVLMAAAVWLVSVRRLSGEYPRPWRAAGLDLLGNVLGGVAVGIPGILWLIQTGAWGPFLEVFTHWNPKYLEVAQLELEDRSKLEPFWFPPWSLGLFVTVPLAFLSVIDAAPWSSRRDAANPARPGPVGRWLPWWLWDQFADADSRFVRGVTGALYLVWVAQSFYIQRGFQYVHVAETLLMLGIWASHRWAWVPVALLYLGATSGLWVAADYNPGLREELEGISTKARERYLPRHPLTRADRLALWPQCLRADLTDAERYELWDRLRLHPPHEASISWAELAEVADFLRSQGVTDGEAVAWFDSPHAVYLMLDTDPPVRYMHVFTALTISTMGVESDFVNSPVMKELADAHNRRRVRFVINDLEWPALWVADDPRKREAVLGPAAYPPDDLLPACNPHPTLFPFNQPTVFRTRNGTGRYVVHRLEEPASGFPYPAWTSPAYRYLVDKLRR